MFVDLGAWILDLENAETCEIKLISLIMLMRLEDH